MVNLSYTDLGHENSGGGGKVQWDTRHQHLCVILHSRGFEPLDVYAAPNAVGRMELHYVFGYSEEVKSLVNDFRLNKPIAVDALRMVAAYEYFKNQLRILIPRE